MATIRELTAELVDDLGLTGEREGVSERDLVRESIRVHLEGTYDDACRLAVELDETGELAARRDRLARAVWADVTGSEWPF